MADNETPLGWLTYPNEGDRSWFSTDAEGQGLVAWLSNVELLGLPTYADFASLPDPTTTPTATNTGGETQRQFAAVVADRTIYRSDGSSWIPWLGSGTLNRRLPDTRYLDSMDANDASVQNAPTSSTDVARQAELDGKADDPHDNTAHSETYATTTQLNNKADDPHDNAAHSEAFTTSADDVEDFATSGATNSVPVSQGDGTLTMQTTVENSDKLDGLDASDFNTDSFTGGGDRRVTDTPNTNDSNFAYDQRLFIGRFVEDLILKNDDPNTQRSAAVLYADGSRDDNTLSGGGFWNVSPADRITVIEANRWVRIDEIQYDVVGVHNHSMS